MGQTVQHLKAGILRKAAELLVDIFTSRKSPAELSLHSVISCCLLISSGQRLGSLDSNGSITYAHTHTRTIVKTIERRWLMICLWSTQWGGGTIGHVPARWHAAALSHPSDHTWCWKETTQCAGRGTAPESRYICSSSIFISSNLIRQSEELDFVGTASREQPSGMKGIIGSKWFFKDGLLWCIRFPHCSQFLFRSTDRKINWLQLFIL